MTHLVGSGKNQIPTNQELGNLAFQNGDVKALGVGDLTATDIQVNANTTSIKPTLNLDFVNFSKSSDYIDPRITYTVSTNANWNGRENYTPKVRTTDNLPRYEFVADEPQGLLCESAATNQIGYSNDMSLWTAVNAGGTVSYGQPAPDGTNTATLISDTSTSATPGRYKGQLVQPLANEVWCASVYIKKDTNTTRFPCLRYYNSSALDLRVHFNTKTGEYVTATGGASSVIVGSGVIDCGDWWRFWISGYFTTAPTGHRIYLYPAWSATLSSTSSNTATGSMIAWGAQAERGAYPTSYVPAPSTTAVTRTIDQYLIQNISSFYNQVEGTIVVEFTSKASVSATVVGFEGSGSADGNSIRIRVGSAGGLLGQIRSSSADVNLITNTYAPRSNYKVAYAYKAGDCGMCVNGGVVQTQSAASIPTVSYMTIGNEYSGASPINSLDGNIKKITYYPKRLSNAELIELTK